MCGFAGIFDLRDRRPIDDELLARMNKALYHRGPDGDGFHVEPGVGLAHRRLSIIDVEGGKQPIYNEDHSVVLVYNGEIYNFVALVRELEACGHKFRTRCDTEVIVHAWEEWGELCVRRFRGMFAFALWDRNQETFFVARDRLGIKPVYYSVDSEGRFVVGSELKAIECAQSVSREIDVSAVEDYFAFGYIPDPKTIFRSVRKLSPGHVLLLKKGVEQPIQRKYWDVSFDPVFSGDERDATAELNKRLAEAVRLRMIADVPLGAFLSGGVDSSAVVATMAEISESPVLTCSISFGDPNFNESSFANAVANRFDTQHFCDQVEADDYSLLSVLASTYDEPFADSSAIPTYRVCELARKHVTVALSGDGGDENLAGYRRYRWFEFEEKFRRKIPDSLRVPIFRFLGSVYPKMDWAPRMFRAKATLEAIGRNSIQGYFHGVSVASDSLRDMLFSDQFRTSLAGYRANEVFDQHAASFEGVDSLSLAQYLDIKTYLPGDILTKVDRASMANSLEVRVPLLDHEIVEWMATLPTGLKLHRGEGKYVFKKAMEGKLPRDVLYRPKMGFAVPLANWFRGPLRDLVREKVLSESMTESGIFNYGTLRNILDQHSAGTRDYSAIVWSLLMFSEFISRSQADERSVH